MQASVPLHDPAALLGRFAAAAAARGFREEPFGEVSGFPLLAFSRRTPGARPRCYLSAGIHGDEPASSLALLELLEAGAFDRRAHWFLCPLLNPVGLARRTRENAQGVDLNRDYRRPASVAAAAHIAWLRRQPNFDTTLCLHEDWESTGMYLYERALAPRPGLAEAILASTSRFVPIEPSGLIDGREALQGIIRPALAPAEMEQWPESVYLRDEHHVLLHYTFESPSQRALAVRVAALRAATETVLAGC
jgi:hypothetical protein